MWVVDVQNLASVKCTVAKEALDEFSFSEMA